MPERKEGHCTISFMGGRPTMGTLWYEVGSAFVHFDSDDGKTKTVLHRSALDNAEIEWT